MDEKKNIEITEDLTSQLAEGLNGSTMSRRERRRLAEAQKAASAPFAQTASNTPSLFDEPAVPTQPEDPREATRVFTPVHVRDIDDSRIDYPAGILRTPAAPAAPAAATEEKTREFFTYNEAKDEEPVKENGPVDVPEAEKEETDEEAPKKKGGLFGKKKSKPAPEEDEADEDGDEDEDEYDRMDDDDDDDDDDEHRSFGYHVIGFFKGLFELILVLLVIILALNVLDFFNVVPLDKLYNRYSPKAPKVFSTLFPSQELKQMNSPATTEEQPAAEEQPFAPVEPAATAETPVMPLEPAATDTAPDAQTEDVVPAA
jgi:hypothetical protein